MGLTLQAEVDTGGVIVLKLKVVYARHMKVKVCLSKNFYATKYALLNTRFRRLSLLYETSGYLDLRWFLRTIVIRHGDHETTSDARPAALNMSTRSKVNAASS